jgi:hypothetical protein
VQELGSVTYGYVYRQYSAGEVSFLISTHSVTGNFGGAVLLAPKNHIDRTNSYEDLDVSSV